MTKLFGLPINTLLYGLVVTLAIGLLFLIISALRNPVLFKTGVRNIWRHPIQTSLIVLGLMLATLLISASLITGDTMNYSIKKNALDDLGPTDEIVQVKAKSTRTTNMMNVGSASSSNSYFEQKYLDKTLDALPTKLVDGVAAILRETTPAASPASRQNLPDLTIMGVQNSYSKEIAPLTTASGKKLIVKKLANDEIYLNSEAAKKLDVKKGGKIKLFLATGKETVKVAGIFDKGGKPSKDCAAVMKLERVQELFAQESKINIIAISNKGNDIEGVKHTKAVINKLKPVYKNSSLEIKDEKKKALDDATEAASSFSSIFLVFGQFSTIAGIMLIFLIFVMLAAERKIELGVLRALGSQSRDILRIFLYEGSVYAVVSAAVGSALGIVVGWAMVKVLAKAFGGASFGGALKLHYYINPKSLIIAYALGVITTFVIVLFSAWRAGHINIVRAIRDLPEPVKKGGTVKRIVAASTITAFGILLVFSGLKANHQAPFFTGISFIIIGIPLIARCLYVPERITFSISGAGLLFVWLIPPNVSNVVFPWAKNMTSGIEMFFVSGIALVAGAIWIVMYNSDILLKGVTTVFGKLKGLPPMLKIAVNYPMKSRFRTGLALAMFSLIVFTIVFMSFMLASFEPLYDDIKTMTGDFSIKGITGYTNPIKDIKKTLDEDGIKVSSKDFSSIGSFSMAGVDVREKDAKNKAWKQYAIQGIDKGYANHVGYDIRLKGKGYKTNRAVWKALVNKPNLVVIHTNLVSAKTDYDVGEQKPPFRVRGFYRDDKKIPDNAYLEIRNPATKKVTKLKIIGVVTDLAMYAYGQMITSQDTINKAMKVELSPQMKMAIASGMVPAAKIPPSEIPATTYWFKVKKGKNVEKIAKNLSKTFYENGMQTTVLKEDINNFTATNKMINRLIQGFMGFGLVVGIAGLGVIAARSVVERRQQIGALRAIGFRKGMVLNTFLLESSFVALLGIAIGMVLGWMLSKNVMDFMAKTMPGIKFSVPIIDLALIVAMAYGASLLTTYIPALQASRVYPAEALRYE
ncbi:MAG: FtsX-like permease family protein [Actinobacteria bacterium]|nr:MAG: FtsX-like permease family protein [Actinomycetota bacterium]